MKLPRALLALLFVVLMTRAAAAVDIAGHIEGLQGEVTATGTTGFSRPLQNGSTLLVGDRIETSAEGRARIKLLDGAIVTLGANSALTIETYEDDNDDNGKALLDVTQGVFLAISGAIARLGPDRFSVTTPVATLGVRGTEAWGEVAPDHLAVAMLSGTEVSVTTPLGSVVLNEPGSGVDVVFGEAPPQPHQWSDERLENARLATAFH
ncbi:MAG: FecR domain-containing protein [Rhodospirillales bacterium]|nr:FecR domain-containing protein [Rhodospirillales bacterium]